MTTPWTWDHKSSPSAVRPVPQEGDEEEPNALTELFDKGRARFMRLRGIAANCREQLAETRVEALVLSGAERHTGQSLSCLYVGARDNLAYLKQLLFAGEPSSTLRETAGLLGARRLVAKHESGMSLVAVDVEWPWNKLFPEQEYLATPCWVNQRLDIPSTWEETTQRLQNEVKRNHARRAKKYGLSARVTHEEGAAKHFYTEMYLPHVTRRFGEACIVETEADVVSLCKDQGLLEISSEGRPVGGSVLQRTGNRQKGVWVAVQGDLDNALTASVFGAIYYYTLVYAYEHGCTVMDYCSSRATLSDGVLGFKRKWGARVQRNTERDVLLLKPLDLSAPTASFFVKNPFLSCHERGFAARLLHREAPLGASELEETVLRYEMGGIELYDVCSTHGFEPAALEWARNDPRLRLRDLSHAEHPAREFCRL